MGPAELPVPGLGAEHAGEHGGELDGMAGGIRHGSSQELPPLRRPQNGLDAAEPFLAGEMVIVGAVGLTNIFEQSGGTAGELAADGVPAAKTPGEHRPMEI